jgi:hypothetical protein
VNIIERLAAYLGMAAILLNPLHGGGPDAARRRTIVYLATPGA